LLSPTILTVKLQVLPLSSVVFYILFLQLTLFKSFDALDDWLLSAVSDLISNTVCAFFSLDLTFLTFCSSVGMHVSFALLIHIQQIDFKIGIKLHLILLKELGLQLKGMSRIIVF
jgi:hypothetical protein